ncbi:hypothetical protein KY333_01540 [Candidatus Woesearchaeota archaeon]|nr:hypothetical protein [Candidatus Woesearchaeota archaeon]MBW2994177.1 hypothetical protein [Candidatus Woesearchaeota archaeon]
MRKAPMLGILAVLLVGVIAIGAFAFPFGEKGQGGGMLYSNDAAKTALDTGDYNAFVSAMEENSMSGRFSELTEARFNEMVERNNQREEQMSAMQETRDAIHNALESGDYDAWHTAVSSLEPVPELVAKITPENFGTYLELHQAKESKDWKTVKGLAEELGLERPGLGIGGGRGMRQDKAPGMTKEGMGRGKGGMGRMKSGMDSSEHKRSHAE